MARGMSSVTLAASLAISLRMLSSSLWNSDLRSVGGWTTSSAALVIVLLRSRSLIRTVR